MLFGLPLVRIPALTWLVARVGVEAMVSLQTAQKETTMAWLIACVGVHSRVPCARPS
jgi:hypothetical protein